MSPIEDALFNPFKLRTIIQGAGGRSWLEARHPLFFAVIFNTIELEVHTTSSSCHFISLWIELLGYNRKSTLL